MAKMKMKGAGSKGRSSVAAPATKPPLNPVIMIIALIGWVAAVIGLVGAVLLSRFLAGLLFGISTNAPLTFLIIPLALLAVSLLACYGPARRAVKIDPAVSLRCE